MADVATLISDAETYRDYEETNSVSRAKLYVSALRGLLVQPKTVVVAGDQYTFDHAVLRAELQDARNFIAANRKSPYGYRRISFAGYRGEIG